MVGKSMDNKTLQNVISQIQRRFPEFSGVQPKVQKQQMGPTQSGKSQAKSASPSTYLLTFHSTGKTASSAQSKSISRWVRVVVNDQGKILKVTTSR
jgi:hypothetical protein